MCFKCSCLISAIKCKLYFNMLHFIDYDKYFHLGNISDIFSKLYFLNYYYFFLVSVNSYTDSKRFIPRLFLIDS